MSDGEQTFGSKLLAARLAEVPALPQIAERSTPAASASLTLSPNQGRRDVKRSTEQQHICVSATRLLSEVENGTVGPFAL